MSNFLSLNTALSGLRAAQLSLDTVSNNVSNANTPGYTRQRVIQSATTPFLHPAGTVGTGVKIDDITRVRDGFLDARVRTTSATLGFHDTLAALLQRTEQMMGEPDHGLTVALGSVFDALDDLALDPAEPSARRQVLAALEGLTSQFREIDAAWTQLANDTQVRLDIAVGGVNEKLQRVAELNDMIPAQAHRGTTPTDLLDERDRILDELSTEFGIQITRVAHKSGATITNLHLGGVVLVDGLTAGNVDSSGGEITLTGADGTSTTTFADIQATNPKAGGEIGALYHYLARDLPGRQAELDGLAESIAGVLNGAHQDAWRNDGGTAVQGGPLVGFGVPPGAANFSVTITQPEHLATALRPDGAPAGWVPSAHDGSAAEQMAALRYARMAGLPGDADPTAGARTLDDRLRAVITGLARDTATATSAADAAEAVHVSARVARQSVHGVSIDEEMAGLVQYQRALEAASRVMTAVDEALDVLINRTGIVGR